MRRWRRVRWRHEIRRRVDFVTAGSAPDDLDPRPRPSRGGLGQKLSPRRPGTKLRFPASAVAAGQVHVRRGATSERRARHAATAPSTSEAFRRPPGLLGVPESHRTMG